MQDFHLNIVVNEGGGNGVSCAPPNSESCTKNVQGSQACKPKKCFNANHRKCLRNLLHNLAEPDQSTRVHQLSMISKTLCTWASEIFFQGGAIVEYSRWSQGVS